MKKRKLIKFAREILHEEAGHKTKVHALDMLLAMAACDGDYVTPINARVDEKAEVLLERIGL